MRLARSYRVLNRAAQARLARLRTLCQHASRIDPPAANRLMSHITVDAVNTWAQFTRYYVLSLALRPVRAAGGRVRLGRPGIAGPHDVLSEAMRLLRPRTPPTAAGTWRRRDEPTWHETRALLTCAAALRVSNLQSIQAALSTGTRVFQDLPVFRNFFAHRNDSSYLTASRLASHYGIPTGHPSLILLARPLGRPWPLIIDWLDDLSLVTERLCE
jgi:hypothetical protein